MFSITGLDSFKKSLEAAKARQLGQINASYRKFVIDILSELVLNTPQWSGDLAASWRVKVEGSSTRVGGSEYTPFKSKPRERPAPHFRGDEAALAYALAVNQEVIDSIRYNSRVTIYNDNKTAEIISTPWMQELWLRPNNFIEGDVMAIAHTISKYNNAHISLREG